MVVDHQGVEVSDKVFGLIFGQMLMIWLEWYSSIKSQLFLKYLEHIYIKIFYRIMMETKFGYVQLVEDKMMEVLWLGVMTVMHGIIGKTFIIFVDVFDCSVFVYVNQ